MAAELVVLSHLRWTFVWQRPQQLISRLSRHFARTWFVEEAEPVAGLTTPLLAEDDQGTVTRLWLQLPATWSASGFDTTASQWYTVLLAERLGGHADRTVWLYTPMALDVARTLGPSIVVYDVMDDLAAFRFAPTGLALRQRQALREADLVFTGGRSLHRSVQDVRPSGAHCFPSGVEPEHYETAIALRRRRSPGGRPVAGYIGVIDERMDLDLLADLATELDDWEIRMVGPVVKIEPSDLPRRGNITYTGARHYAELPTVLAGFDVALMPFAVDDATRAISPTKTLEYLAAGLPVVSTPVPDVVADYAAVVAIAPDAAGFAAACRHTLGESAASRSERVWPMLHAQRWDVIADKMRVLMDGAGREPADAVEESA